MSARLADTDIGLYTFAELTPNARNGDVVTPAERLRNPFEEGALADEVGLDVYGVGEHHRRISPCRRPPSSSRPSPNGRGAFA